MRTKEANQLEALRNVQAFLDEQRNRLPTIATSGARRQLDDALARLAQHADDQTSSAAWSRNCTKRYHALRRRLIRSHLVPIALIARATRPPLSELAQFRIPRGKATALQLAAATHAMAEAAAPRANTFVAAGMPEDFIDQMERASEAMMAELEARTQERARHRIATEALRAGISSARRIVKVLDAFVRSACELDVEMIAGWETVTHVRRSVRRPEPLPADSREPLQLTATGVAEVREAPVREHESIDLPPAALPRRVLALLAVRGRARFAVGA